MPSNPICSKPFRGARQEVSGEPVGEGGRLALKKRGRRSADKGH